jgi:hypothetical protein
MKMLSNLPPGVTDSMIERQQGGNTDRPRQPKHKDFTPAQIRLLARFDSRGLFDPGNTVTDPYRNKGRALNRMVGMGLVKHYVHGGYELTDAGRIALSESKGGETK